MKGCLLVLLNYVFYRDIELLFGKNSIVDILSVKYCTTKKSYMVDCKLYLSDIDLFEESQISSLNVVIEDCWKYTGLGSDNLIIQSSYDLLENYSSS
jgi:hypothetical protein